MFECITATKLWNPTISNFQMNPISKFVPQVPVHQIQHESVIHNTSGLYITPFLHINDSNNIYLAISWDKEFNALESHLVSSSDPLPLEEIAQKESSQQPADDDELARTAAVLLETVKDETNPKFQNSQFLGLMKQLRDGEMIVEGNQMVERDGRTSSTKVDVKGKGRAIDHVLHSTLDNLDSGPEPQSSFLDANDSYFQQENADYMRYWNESQDQPQGLTEESLSWDYLQEDWENYEATATGIKAMTHYQFQENNPYLLGDPTATRQHLVHTYGRQSVFEVCPFFFHRQRSISF